MTVSRPVGGILSSAVAGAWVAIHLSGLPGDHPRCGRAARPTAWPCSGWGLPSRPSHPGRWCALTAPFHPYLCRPVARTAIGGLFSVALSCGSPRLAVSQHPALRSPDLPRPGPCSCRGHPADSPSRPVCQPHSRVATGKQRPLAASARGAPGGRDAQTYDAGPTARVTLPNGDGNSSSSGSTPVRMIEWRRSVAPTDWMVWRSSGVENSGTHT